MSLLENNRDAGLLLGETLIKALENIRNCQACRNFTENELCNLCADQSRDDSMMCIVESPSDVMAIEQSKSFKGRYFVLMGHLSPIDGVGPDELGIEELIRNLKSSNIKEVIVAKPIKADVAGNKISVPKELIIELIENPIILFAIAAPLPIKLNNLFASLALKDDPVKIQNWIVMSVKITSDQMYKTG